MELIQLKMPPAEPLPLRDALTTSDFARVLFLSPKYPNRDNRQWAIPQGNVASPYPRPYHSKSHHPQAIINAGITALRRQYGFV
jgi:hypothetical protein